MAEDLTSPSATAAACEAQLADIRKEVGKHPLLTLPVPLDMKSRLVEEVKEDPAYLAQAQSLFGASTVSTKQYHFSKIRYARRDGNCFYRCAGFRLCELIVQQPERASAYLTRLADMETLLTALFGDFVADFTEVLKEIWEAVAQGKMTTTAQLYQKVTSDDGAYLIVALRYIVSAYLQTNEEEYVPFVEGMGFPSVKEYCNTEVETVDHESDNIQMAAFAKVFDVCLRVYGMDRNAGFDITEYTFNDEENEDGHRLTLELQFMPGHYNLLEQ